MARKSDTIVDNWSYVPLSEPRIVAGLIIQRSEQDLQYDQLSSPFGIIESAGTSIMDTERMCTFMDLDNQIETCGLSKSERQTVDMQMDGYGMSDVAERYQIAVATVSSYQDRAVAKIVEANNKRWSEVYSPGSPYA